ncbi:delta-60 repeat domain-containing protein [Flaviaesturariibacter amylovorans]|uniref:Delta-60 repeat domain-containing protein n=1 Tax=Flaviaesturariibacter amylovorans TaxID=1084520 RepID=A0ABP8HVF6_9BACT
MRTLFLLTLLLCFCTSRAFAQDGTPDLTFNSADSGHYRGDGALGAVYVTLPLPDGKLLLGGYFVSYNGSKQQKLVRLHPDGRLDTTFNQGGTGVNGNAVRALALQPDGRILVAGELISYNGVPSQGVLRLHPDGSRDASFATAFIANAGVGLRALALQPDGKILIGGDQYSVGGVASRGISRLNADGSLDNSFTGAAGQGTVLSVALQSTGAILIGGSFEEYGGVTKRYLARLQPNGSLDAGFPAGPTPDASVSTIVPLAGDALYIGGSFGTPRPRLARLLADGSPDATFVPDPNHTQPTVLAVAPTADGKVLIGGLGNGLYRLLTNGTRDAAFNANAAIGGYIQYSGGTLGAQYNVAYAISALPGGSYIVGGEFSQYGDTVVNGIVRISAAGYRDGSFNRGSGANNGILAAAPQGDGKLVVAGYFTAFNEKTVNGITRLLPDGTPDPAFNVNGRGVKWDAAMGEIQATVVQPDGAILIGGNINRYNGAVVRHLARLLPNGYLDNSFNPGGTGVGGGTVSAIALQPDGKILIGGSFNQYNGHFTRLVARLLPDGSVDPAFTAPFSGANAYEVDAVRVHPDGKLVVTGNFELFSSGVRRHVVRLLPDGSVDATFGIVNNRVHGIEVQADGKLLLAGEFSQYNNTGVSALIRINTDGTVDPSFAAMPAGTRFGPVLALPGGKLLAVATGYFGGDTTRILRLNADGTLDPTFAPVLASRPPGSALANYPLIRLALQADGPLLAYGLFTQLNGTGRNRVARIGNTVAPQLTLGNVTPLTLCAGSNIQVPFQHYGLPAGSIITVQLSDASGSFASPVAIGSSTGTAQGIITAGIPAGTAAGTGYRLRLVSGALLSADNGADIAISAAASQPTWNGAVSTDWNDARNWCGGVPAAGTDALIPAGAARVPLVSNNAQVRHLTVAAGATLSMNTVSYMTLFGNLTVQGNFAASGGLNFRGTTPQSVSALTVARMEVNGAGVQLAGPVTLTGALTLTQGHITLGDQDLTLSGPVAFGSPAAHVITNGTGALRVTGASGIYNFPVGAAAATYNPITITDYTGRSFRVQVRNSIAPAITSPLRGVNRTWIVTPSAASATPASVQLTYADAEGNAQFVPGAAMDGAIHNGSGWNLLPAGGLTVSGTPAQRFATFSTAQFGPVVVGNAGAIGMTTALDPRTVFDGSASLRPALVRGASTELLVRTPQATRVTWQLLDAGGAVLRTFEQVLRPGDNRHPLATGALPAGVYGLVGTTSKGQRIVLRLVKQ